MVILDNAGEWHAVSGLIPPGLHLLVTTRTRNFGGNEFRHQELGVLSEEASTSFLVQMVPSLGGDPALAKLVKTLEGHALALELAGGTIESLGLSAGMYLERMNRQQPDPDIVVKGVKYGKTVEGCLALSWDGLQRDASRVLWRRASLFAPTSAHRDLLRVSFVGDMQTRREMEWMREKRPEHFGKLGPDALLNYEPGEFDQAYAELRAMNVLSRVEGFNGERWAIHRLVRDYGRARLQAGEVLMHAMAMSEWLRSPTLDTAPEIPHLVATILDAAKYVVKIDDVLGARSSGSTVAYRSPVLLDSKYFIEHFRGELHDPRALTLILDGLTNINEDVRVAAIRLLENLGHIPEIMEGLTASLDDPDPGVRTTASQTIAKHGGPKIVDLLCTVMRSDKPRARLEAVRTLGLLREPAVAALKKAFKSHDDAVRVEAALLLGEQGQSEGKELIVGLLGSPAHPQDLPRAIRALGRMGDTSAFPLLLDLLEDNRPSVQSEVVNAVRAVAGQAIAKHCDQEKIIDLLLATVRSDRPRARREAVRTLGLLGVPGQAALAEGLSSGDAAVRVEAALLLGEQGRSEGKELIVGVLRSPTNSQDLPRAIRALGRMGDTSVFPLLLDLVEHNLPYYHDEVVNAVRAVAGRAIAKQGDQKKIIDLLLATVRGDKPRARREAVRTLGLLGAPAQAALAEGLSSGDAAVRVEAALLLGEQGRSDGKELIVGFLRSPTHFQDLARAIRTLGNIKVAIPADVAADLLKLRDWQVRQECLRTLGMTKAAESVPILIDALGDSDHDVRCEAARALGLIGDSRARIRLAEVAVKDTRPSVKKAANEALAQLDPTPESKSTGRQRTRRSRRSRKGNSDAP